LQVSFIMTDTTKDISTLAFVPFLVVAFVGVSAHALLLFTDYVLWDGVWMLPHWASHSQTGGTELYSPEVLRLYGDMGKPLDLIYLAPFIFLHGAIVPKVAGFFVWLSGSLLALYVMKRLGLIPPAKAIAVASIMVALPVFDVLGDISVWMNAAAVAVFWSAWVAFTGFVGRRGFVALALRLCALGLFFVSFTLNSLLLFFYGAAAFLLLCRWYYGQRGRALPYMFKSSLRLIDFLLLPFAFWVFRSFFTPISGYGQKIAYNQIRLEPQLLEAGGRSLVAFLFEEVWNLLVPLSVVGVLMVLALVGIKRANWSISRLVSIGNGVVPREGLLLFGAGLALLVCSTLPYALVGQNVASSGWWSRNCVLTPLPIALLICGGLILMNSLLAPHRPQLWFLACLCVAFASAVASNLTYFTLQALGAKQKSIEIEIHNAITEKDAVVVQLRDYFIITQSVPYYPPAIWTYIAAAGAAHPKTFVFDVAPFEPPQEIINALGERQIVFPAVQVSSEVLGQMLEQTSIPYMLKAIPREGPQIMFIVQQGKYGSNGFSIGARYLWLRWFRPDKLPQFVNDLTETAELELPSVGLSSGG